VYAPSTLVSFPHEFTHGDVLQLQSAARVFLVQLARRTPLLLRGVDQLCFVGVDTTLRRVSGEKTQCAAFDHAKVGGYNALLRGYNPLLATIFTMDAAPVTARMDHKIRAAAEDIAEQNWLGIRYPKAIWDDEEQRFVFSAEIAETTYTAFEVSRHAITARLIVRRITRANPKQATGQDELFAP